MGIQSIAHRVNNISLNNPDPPAKKAIRQTPSERSMPPFNEKSLKQPIPQFPTIRSIHPNECPAKKWIDGQLNKNTSETYLLFQIAKKSIAIPNELSLNHVMKHLIQDKEGLNTRDEDGNTPLYWASKTGNLEVVKYLIEEGADVKAKKNWENTPLNMALLEGHLEIAKLLIDHGADVNTSAPLYWASKKGRLDVAKLLIQNGADMYIIVYKDGCTPLHWAIVNDHIEVVQLFIDHGVNVNRCGMTRPLHLASLYGHLKMVKLLIKHGVDINDKETYNETPLHVATEKGHLEIVKLLIKHGADVNAKNMHKKTALHLASLKGHLEIVKLLIDHGAYLNAKERLNYTPLDLASANGHLEIVKFLIDHGVDLNTKGKFNFTPHYASLIINRYLEIAQLLVTINHLDNNDSMDSLTSDIENFFADDILDIHDIENLTADQIKSYYKIHQEEIDSLMEQRKIYRMALSIIHTPEKVELNHDLNQENIIYATLFYTRAFNRFRFLPASVYFPVKTIDKITKIPSWKFIMEGLQFFSIEDALKLALLNKQFYSIYSIFFTNLKNDLKNDFKKYSHYIKNDKKSIEILIQTNLNATHMEKTKNAIKIQKLFRGSFIRKNNNINSLKKSSG